MDRFDRWRRAVDFDKLLQAFSKTYDDSTQMIDSSSIRVHQHAANCQKKPSDPAVPGEPLYVKVR